MKATTAITQITETKKPAGPNRYLINTNTRPAKHAPMYLATDKMILRSIGNADSQRKVSIK